MPRIIVQRKGRFFYLILRGVYNVPMKNPGEMQSSYAPRCGSVRETSKAKVQLRTILSLALSVGTVFYPSAVKSQAESSPEWKYVATWEDHNDIWKTYYDLNSVDRKPESKVEVWLKQIQVTKTEDERRTLIESIIQNRKLNKMPITGYENFAYSLSLVEFDCGNKLVRDISIRDYNERGKLLGGQTILGLPFDPVTDESLEGMLLEAVCNPLGVLGEWGKHISMRRNQILVL